LLIVVIFSARLFADEGKSLLRIKGAKLSLMDRFNNLPLLVKGVAVLCTPVVAPLLIVYGVFKISSSLKGAVLAAPLVLPQTAVAGLKTPIPTSPNQVVNLGGKLFRKAPDHLKDIKPIAEAYRYDILGDFSVTPRNFIKQSLEQWAEATAKANSKKIGTKFLQIAREQLADFNLVKYAQGKVPPQVATVFLEPSGKLARKDTAANLGIVARRLILLDMIKQDRDANYIPLAYWQGEKAPDELKRSRFLTGDIFDPKKDKKETFTVAREFTEKLADSNNWEQIGADDKEIALIFYNYAVSKIAHVLNKEGANSYDFLFNDPNPKIVADNAEIYRQACEWGLVDFKTRSLIAARAEIEGRQSGNFSAYNFSLFCLTNDNLLAGQLPNVIAVAKGTRSFAENFIRTLHAGTMPVQKQFTDSQQIVENIAFKQELREPLLLDKLRGDTVKSAFGKGGDTLASNIAALQGIANGVGTEAANPYGQNRIRQAWNNPNSRFAVFEGTLKTMGRVITGILSPAAGR
jgi:hypothetical protein